MNEVTSQLKQVFSRFRRLNHRHVMVDIPLIILSFYGSLFLRLGFEDFGAFVGVMTQYLGLFVLLRLVTFAGFGVYDTIWRYVSFSDASRMARATCFSAVLIIAATYIVDTGRLPRAVFFLDTVLSFILLGGIRFGRRWLHETSSGKEVKTVGRKTLIYGAGNNGRTLAQRFKTDGYLGYSVVGFIDDNPQKSGRYVGGLKVLGALGELPEILKSMGIQELVVAIGQPSGALLREIVQACRVVGIQPRLVSGVSQSGDRKRIEVVREIGLHELLNRSRRTINLSDVRSLVGGRRVLITGAGGSIGSEIARQVKSLSPTRLLLLDHSELNLYQIDHELREASGRLDSVVPILVDVKDRSMLFRIFEQYRPEVVFHAAAYKHVHMVECNPCSAILNNVEGMKNLLELSEEFDVGDFVLISTDKAVNPVGLMGATKRLCELMLAEVGHRTGKRFCAVRFGNVLGSSGSFIPLLKRQVESGGPVTITHKDMQRFFMLIPEAVGLVLKAGVLAKPGNITILKMGDPVKIVDIAKSMIALMGRTEEEIPIVFTGVRPGEKLFEELYLCGDEVKTGDPDILVLPSGDGAQVIESDSKYFKQQLDSILQLARQGNSRCVDILKALIHYKPAGGKRPLLSSSPLQEEGLRSPGRLQ